METACRLLQCGKPTSNLAEVFTAFWDLYLLGQGGRVLKWTWGWFSAFVLIARKESNKAQLRSS